jgi:N-acetylglucosamine-6-sulfatase
MAKTVLPIAAMVTALLLACAGMLVALVESEASAQTPPKPNIVFVLTDDQDAESLEQMPTVQRELIGKGTTFENGILTLPVCCPSRATMLRGQYAHNHVIGIGEGQNGALAFRRRGLENSTVATWLDKAGYRTALVGKYLNGYDRRYVPAGWDKWYANVSQDVWAECLNENGKKKCYGGKHPDAVLADKAEGFVRSSRSSSQPLFLWLSLNAPHDPAPYMRQDRNMFSNRPLPKPPSFDEPDVSDKPAWVKRQPRISPKRERDLRKLYLDRLRSLQTADRAVGRLVDALDDTGRLENTYFVYFTDNGYHLGEHRVTAAKATPYLEAVRFPLVVRGPGVQQGETRQDIVLNTDIGPTFAALGGAETPQFVDGRSITPLLQGQQPTSWRNSGLIEGRRSRKQDRPAYAGLITENRTYVEYGNGQKELYDLETDQHQLENLAGKRPDEEPALAAQLQELRNCSGASCRAAEDGTIP